jgi:hypothetical protein
MKMMKNFDFFQKISVDNIAQPTMLGSLLSLSAIGLMVFLLLGELSDLITPKIKKDTIVYHDKDQTSRVKVNLDVKFSHLPCYIISVDQEDSIGNHRLDVSDTLIKKRLSKTGQEIRTPIDETLPYFQLVENAILQDEGCLIEGYIEINKVPGNIHISHHKYGDLYMYLKFNRPELFNKMYLNHKINVLNFGDAESNSYILDRFGYNDNTAFDRSLTFPDYSSDLLYKSYDYYVKLIPHLFIDNTIGEQFMSYQYSITSKAKDFNPNGQAYEMPIIMINYDLSPITMKVTLDNKNILHSLTHICAIVGGVFVIFSIINRIILSLFDFSDNKVAANS